MKRTILYSILAIGLVISIVAYLDWLNDDQVTYNLQSAIQSCAKTDFLNKSEFVFFGPSNNIPPGSIWKKEKNGGFHLLWGTDDIFTDVEAVTFTKSGAWASCTFSMDLASSVAPNVFLEANLKESLSPKLSNILAKSSSAKVGLKKWRLDLLKEGPYFHYVRGRDLQARSLGEGGCVVMHKALLIRGFFMELDFDKGLSADLEAVVKDQLFSGGSKLKIKKIAKSKLRIESESDIYIAGAFAEYADIGSGILSQPPKLLPLTVKKDTPLSREMPK